MNRTLEADVRSCLNQGGIDAKFKIGLANIHGVSVEVVEQVIAAAGPQRKVSAEEVAQERLSTERRTPKNAAYRAWNHEE